MADGDSAIIYVLSKVTHAQRQNGSIAIQSCPWFSQFCLYIGDASDKIQHVTAQVAGDLILRLPIVPGFDTIITLFWMCFLLLLGQIEPYWAVSEALSPHALLTEGAGT